MVAEQRSARSAHYLEAMGIQTYQLRKRGREDAAVPADSSYPAAVLTTANGERIILQLSDELPLSKPERRFVSSLARVLDAEDPLVASDVRLLSIDQALALQPLLLVCMSSSADSSVFAGTLQQLMGSARDKRMLWLHLRDNHVV